MFSRFFIDRPIFSSVISIVIVLVGAVLAPRLPIAQYPDVTPPLIQVTTSYPGATGQIVSDTVATPIEQQINGADNMLYMESLCAPDGTMTIKCTFDVGTDPNIDQVLTQNRVAMATPSTPDLVQKQGLITQKSNPSILLAVQLFSPDGSYDSTYLSNYFKIQIYDELLRIPGVGQVNILGLRDYSVRIWLNPDKLAARDVTASDVVKAVQEQNVQVAAGMLGMPPVPTGVESTQLVNVLGRLNSLEQFADIVINVGADGEILRLRDVGRVELGGQNYAQNCTYDGKPAVAGAVFALPGSNAIDVANAVYAKMKELKKRFRPGIEYDISYDTTLFVRESAAEVFWTLVESSVIVAAVIFLFLQNWRTALIPIISLPVSIVGAFAIMAAFGFSLNNLSLFGLVLAIGIVVDDAIVVVENVEHHMEHGLGPKEAAFKAMAEISGAVIAVTLVLSCVFIPAAFITGVTGEFYKQFALTIAGSTVISGLNSLTLSPALCGVLLKTKEQMAADRDPILPGFFWAVVGGLFGAAIALAVFRISEFRINILRTILDGLIGHHASARSRWIALGGFGLGALAGLPAGWLANRGLEWFFKGFNWVFTRGTGVYAGIVAKLLRVSVIAMLIYAGLLFLTVRTISSIPTGFIPEMDKGYLFAAIKLPDGATLQRTDEVVKKVAKICSEADGVGHTLGVSGYSLVTGSNSNSLGTVICVLKPFEERHSVALRADSVARALAQRLSSVREAIVIPFGAPPIDGLGASGGFKLQIQDRENLGPEILEASTQRLIRAGNAQKGLFGLTSSYTASLPQLFLDIDRTQAKTLGVNLGDVFQTLQIYVGSLYVNQVNLFGRTWQVNIQAEDAFRLREEDIRRLRVRNSKGEMVPLGTLAQVTRVTGPERVTRYNMYRSAEINGMTRPGFSSGQAIAAMETLARRELPPSMTISWTDLYYQQIAAGNTSTYVFMFGALLVFLVLAAQYESWRLPMAVVLIVPMCLLCAFAGLVVRTMDNNIFTQVGLLVLVGLASKNAILIVEFAKQKREEGVARFESAVEASRSRLRPILMTSACFIHLVPLYFAVGAGAEMRRPLATAVLWGAFGVTLFGVFLTPIFFYVIDRFGQSTPVAEHAPATGSTAAIPPAANTH